MATLPTRTEAEGSRERNGGSGDAEPGPYVTDGGVLRRTIGSARPRSSGADEDGGEDGQVSADVAAETRGVEPLSIDVVFEIAKNKRRRLALQYVAARDGPVAVGELAEHIAALENDKDVGDLTSTERKRVYIGMYQCHLPKMDGAGVINFDRNPGITLGDSADQVLAYVDEPGAVAERPWPRYYLALAAGGTALLGTAVAGSSVAAALVGPVVTGALLTVAAGHAYVQAR